MTGIEIDSVIGASKLRQMSRMTIASCELLNLEDQLDPSAHLHGF